MGMSQVSAAAADAPSAVPATSAIVRDAARSFMAGSPRSFA
jgi:hypothetical protein